MNTVVFVVTATFFPRLCVVLTVVSNKNLKEGNPCVAFIPFYVQSTSEFCVGCMERAEIHLCLQTTNHI